MAGNLLLSRANADLADANVKTEIANKELAGANRDLNDANVTIKARGGCPGRATALRDAAVLFDLSRGVPSL